MRITQWLSRLLDDEPPASRPRAPAAVQLPQVLEVNVRNAIEMHQAWKRRLEASIRARAPVDDDPRLVARDDACPLGRWIHGAGAQQFGDEPHFIDLKARHAAFHVCAARILQLARAGEHERALQELASDSEFASLSWEVIGDLASMFGRLEGTRA
jgi:hypothetical protein